jgi:hypothetical protein
MNKFKLPEGHNHTTAKFQRVSRGVDYAYAGYTSPPVRQYPFMGAFFTFFIAVILIAARL